MNKTLEQWANLDPKAQRTPAETAILIQHAKEDIAELTAEKLAKKTAAKK
jgi:hypothetical protein